ncbi:MAG: amidohydrolase family protein [Phycisphaerales bacterium]|nr:amidohydrolase family protein [Phycisphaerales bacterium]
MRVATRTALIVAMSLASLASVAQAQSRQVPGADQDGPLLFKDAVIHPVSSPMIEQGWMLVEDGRISAIGGGELPRGTRSRVINLNGRHVYPGLVAADSLLGLSETGAVDVTHDYDEQGSITPEARAVVAINPDSDIIPVTRQAGILTALVVPSGGRLPGKAAAIRLDGWTWEDLAIEGDAGLVIEWPGTERSGWGRRGGGGGATNSGADRNIEELNRTFDEAQAWLNARQADPALPLDSRWAAMAPAIEGTQPVFIKASTAGQIATAVAWAKGRNLDAVIVGGEEADRVANILIEADVPVVVRGTHRYPVARHEAVDEPHTLPRRLRDLGVRFCIAPRDRPAHLRNLPHHAATAVANGLTPDEGLRSITIDAAEIIGVGDRLGSLEPGKAATFIVTNGDPLEMTTQVEQAYIDGRAVELESRQSELRDKYREKYTRQGRIAS